MLNGIKVVPWAREIFENPEKYHYLVGLGGRGRGATQAFALWHVLRMLYGHNVLCVRQFQNSIEDSNLAIMRMVIQRSKLERYFDLSLKYEIRCTESGAHTAFKGAARNINSLKSMAGYQHIWWEEAQDATNDGLDVLLPSWREDGQTVAFTYNQVDPTDPICRFTEATPDRTWIAFKTFEDNPFFPAILEEERQRCLLQTPDLYPWIWEGGFKPYNLTNPFGVQGVMAAHKAIADLAPLGSRIVAGVDLSYTGDPNRSDYTTVVKGDENYRLMVPDPGPGQPIKMMSDDSSVRRNWIKQRILEEPIPSSVLVDITGGGRDMCENIRQDLQPHGITVNGVSFTKPQKVLMVRHLAEKFGERRVSYDSMELHKEFLDFNEDLKTGHMAAAKGHDDLVAGALLVGECLRAYEGRNEMLVF